MKVKEDIVCDKNGCAIICFTDLGYLINTLQILEQAFTNSVPNVAKQMLALRGLLSSFVFQYPTCSIMGDYLFSIAWEVVKHLECAGCKVISLTGDKAFPNRKCFQMHRLAPDKVSGEVYRIPKPIQH